jgi:hypothetical protein
MPARAHVRVERDARLVHRREREARAVEIRKAAVEAAKGEKNELQDEIEE